MINSFKNTPIYSIHSHSYIFNSEGPQIYYSSITIAPTPSAAAKAAAKKYLQDIYKQKLKDYKQEHTYKVTLNLTTLKIFTASIAQAKLVIKEIYQAYLAAIKKNLTIINTVEIDFSKFFLPPTVKSLDLLLSKILIFKVAII